MCQSHAVTVFCVCQVDHWLELSSGRLSCASEFAAALDYLDHKLATSTYLIGKSATLADVAVWSTLRSKFDIESLAFDD